MEKNTKISILKKIAIILLAIVICYFIIPTPVNAASWLVNAGGKLVDTVLQLFIFLGDSIMNLLQNNFISTESAIIEAEAASTRTWLSEGWIEITIGLLIAVIGVCIGIASFGTLSGVTAGTVLAGIKIVGGVLLTTAAGGIVAVAGTNELIDDISGVFDLPQIRYTPYEIFSGQIPVFDVNFIKPMESVKSESVGTEIVNSLKWELVDENVRMYRAGVAVTTDQETKLESLVGKEVSVYSSESSIGWGYSDEKKVFTVNLTDGSTKTYNVDGMSWASLSDGIMTFKEDRRKRRLSYCTGKS